MLHQIRKQYELSSLDEQSVHPNPFEQFHDWLHQAIDSDQPEPTAMVLSTVDENRQPHSRVVLLKEFSPDGFVFYTNYEGHKAQEMAQNRQVSLLFFWSALERQVRVLGAVAKVSVETSTSYFESRPLESQLGTWASPQSQVIPSKETLIQQFYYYQSKYGEKVPKPPHWGGYVVEPQSFEFWQGRPNRLHDRLLFSNNAGKWEICRLAP